MCFAASLAVSAGCSIERAPAANHAPAAGHATTATRATTATQAVAAAGRPLPDEARTADIVLIGEVHDNVEQHRLRLRWLEELTRDRRVAIALEQFDADRQAELERARAQDASADTSLPARARRLAEAAGFEFRGWDWDLYGPVIELALRRDLPLVAANLSPSDTAQVARGQAPAAPPPPGWSDADSSEMAEAIRDGHCGLLSEKAVQAMGTAQRTRDAKIADSIAAARARTGLPVVLLAGNGHVRRDIGVPRYLAALRPSDSVVTIAMLEDDDAHADAFDHAVRTATQPREDPCEALRERRTTRGSG